MLNLGDKVKDIISGFTGIATDTLNKDGEPIEGQWFDDQRVVVLEQRERPMSPSSQSTTGGPQRYPAPKR